MSTIGICARCGASLNDDGSRTCSCGSSSLSTFALVALGAAARAGSEQRDITGSDLIAARELLSPQVQA